MTIIPGDYDITIYQGATFNPVFIWKAENGDPVDLTNYSARMMARPSAESQRVFFELSSDDSTITLGGIDGAIAPIMSAEETANITDTSGVYDLELTAQDGTVTRLLHGRVLISREVTR